MALAAAALLVGVAGVVTAAPSQANLSVCPVGYQPTVHTITPRANFQAEISKLCAGDTLALEPGTYVTGYLRFYADTPGPTGITKASAARPITVTAADPSQPPLIQGGLQFTGANYWRFSYLRVQATAAGLSALYMNGGVGWSVRFSEFFGARATNSYANVVISGSKGYPRGFEFRGNLVHDAAISNRADATDHNLYVNFQGATGSGGLITRNVLWNAPHGVGIKLGNGGAANALGPWGVVVSMNTIYNSGRSILLHGNVRSNTIYGNLLQRATAKFARDPRTTLIYVHDVTGPKNYFHHNYGFTASMFAYDPKRAVAIATGNRMYNDAAHNPVLRSSTAGILMPQNAVAKPYGAAGTGRWP